MLSFGEKFIRRLGWNRKKKEAFWTRVWSWRGTPRRQLTHEELLAGKKLQIAINRENERVKEQDYD
jgi:hypothetical protein